MMRVLFLVKGDSFLRTVIPMLIESQKLCETHVFAYAMRPGKEDDSFSISSWKKIANLAHLHDVNLTFVSNDSDCYEKISNLKSVDAIICQDPQHHFPFLSKYSDRVFSVSFFTDTIHRVKEKNGLDEFVPRMTFFPSAEFKNLYLTLFDSVHMLGHTDFLDPLDHPIFDQERCITNKWSESTPEEKIDFLFITPPVEFIQNETLDAIIGRLISINEQGGIVKIKARKKQRFDPNLFGNLPIVYDDGYYPYASLEMMLRSKAVITSYSISGIESSRFRIPFFNIVDVDDNFGCGNLMTKSYDLCAFRTDKNPMCHSLSKNNIEDLHRIIPDFSFHDRKRRLDQEFQSNKLGKTASMRIMEKILDEISS